MGGGRVDGVQRAVIGWFRPWFRSGASLFGLVLNFTHVRESIFGGVFFCTRKVTLTVVF